MYTAEMYAPYESTAAYILPNLTTIKAEECWVVDTLFMALVTASQILSCVTTTTVDGSRFAMWYSVLNSA
jgi:hypothetical protein